ncbi:MAG: YheC/YheD family protein [Bacillota bacterium]|nr:YheC/YheD family protein [Bacillota bacterium]
MSNVFTIKVDPNTLSEFLINPKSADEINISSKKFAYINFGNRSHHVSIKVSENIPENIIALSQDTLNDIYLPYYPSYEMTVNNNQIILGPFIGLLIKKEDKDITESSLKKMSVYVKRYAELNGAIVVFALDKVNTSSGLIEGYCYNPVFNSWQRGIFPYPSSIYRTIGLNQQWKNHFHSVLGDCVFNNHYFNKWEMYKWLHSNIDINPHLPYTILYQAPDNALDMLERFGEIYIKPIKGLKGHGVIQASRDSDIVNFRFRSGKQNHSLKLDSIDKISDYLQIHFRNKKYIVQQSIEVMKYGGSVWDFRCMLLKDNSGMWKCNAIFGRCGEEDSIVSNISSGGRVLSAEDLLRDAMLLSDQNVIDIKNKMESLAIKVCAELDKCGINSGILGLDIAVDVHGHLWIIEINNRDPCAVYALDLGDEELYNRLKTTPLYYAKYLAGFCDKAADSLT